VVYSDLAIVQTLARAMNSHPFDWPSALLGALVGAGFMSFNVCPNFASSARDSLRDCMISSNQSEEVNSSNLGDKLGRCIEWAKVPSGSASD
jgi:hypothetical protein